MKGKMVKRYSRAFKQKVVKEIEEGKITSGEAKKLYNITGAQDILIACADGLKGSENVNGEFALMCIGHNINKLY